MKWAAALVASLAFIGCQQSSAETLQELQARQAQLVEELHIKVMAPYREWAASPPYDCTSPKLRTSANGASAFADSMLKLQARQQDLSAFRELYSSGDWQIEVADGARQHGCTEFARQVYYDVLSTYIGSRYAALRQRAEIGIEEVLSAEQILQGTSQPKNAQSAKTPR